MALPKPIRTDQHLTVYSPHDDDVTGPPGDVSTRYLAGDWTALDALTVGPGATPIVVRPLSEVELDLARAEVARMDDAAVADLSPVDVAQWVRSLQWELPRYGLVTVDGAAPDGQERVYGRSRWTDSALDALLDGRTRRWLGALIHRLSTVGPTSAVSSGSSHGPAGGTTADGQTPEASASATPPPSTAPGLAALAARVAG